MHRTLVDKKCIAVVLIVTFVAMSCTSYKVAKLPGIENRVKVGETIRVVTTDGRDVQFKVTGITADTIVGENHHILLSDITTLERRRISPGKTMSLIGGILTALLAGILLYSAATCCQIDIN